MAKAMKAAAKALAEESVEEVQDTEQSAAAKGAEAVKAFAEANSGSSKDEDLMEDEPEVTPEEQAIAPPPQAAAKVAPVPAKEISDEDIVAAQTAIIVLKKAIEELAPHVAENASLKRASGKVQEAIYSLQAALK